MYVDCWHENWFVAIAKSMMQQRYWCEKNSVHLYQNAFGTCCLAHATHDKVRDVGKYYTIIIDNVNLNKMIMHLSLLALVRVPGVNIDPKGA